MNSFYERISIVVNSCDKFKDAWDPFFRLLNKYWADHPHKILLNSETIEYDNKSEKVITVLNNKSDSWTERIRNTVLKTDTDYILFFLEDYFIWDYVDENIFETAFSLLEDDDNAGAVIFHGVSLDPKYNTSFESDDVFVEQSKRIISRAHVCVTLFKKDFFLKMLCMNENPWRYERESYARSLAIGKKIYAQNYRVSIPCFLYYLKPRDNIGINQGKWLKDTKPMFEKNEIFDIDYENLGVYEEALRPNMELNPQIKDDNIKEKLYSKYVKKLKYSLFGRKLKSLYYRFYFAFKYK